MCVKGNSMRKKYLHSAYYYAYHYGWTYSEARTYTGKYLDMHTYRPRMRERPDGEWNSKDWFKYQSSPKEFDSTFNPLMLLACAAVDIGIAMRDTVSKLADPVERDRMKRELMRDLRRIRRPFYYAREVERRRELSDPDQEHNSTLTAVLCREGIYPFSESVVGSRRLRLAVHLGAALSCLGSLLGLLLAYYLTSVEAFASISPLTLLLYLVLWAIPCWLITGWADQY